MDGLQTIRVFVVLVLFRNCFSILVNDDHEELMKLKQDIQMMKAKQDELTLANSALKAQISGNAVGFTAKYGRTDNKTLIFTTVVTNEGAGYDPATGKFTCPVDGLYLFHITMVTSTPGTANIMKNGVYVLRAYSGAKADTSDGKWDGDSNTVILKLLKGDSVWITDGGISVDGDSNFSGVLIQAY